jgi:PAT family beta-lactamase induction signal transducer AmpG
MEELDYVNFYLLTTIVALPGVLLFWWMSRNGFVEASIGSAATASAQRDESGK